jgi:hypothetical protein
MDVAFVANKAFLQSCPVTIGAALISQRLSDRIERAPVFGLPDKPIADAFTVARNASHLQATRDVGGLVTRVPEMRLFLRVLSGERWGENEGPGTARKLDRISDLFSVTYDGGEGGIRSRGSLPHQWFRPDPNPSNTKSSQNLSIRYKTGTSATYCRHPIATRGVRTWVGPKPACRDCACF